MDTLWDRVARLTGSSVLLPGLGGNRLLVVEVRADAVLVQAARSKTRQRLLQGLPLHRVSRADIEVAAAMVQPGVPLTALVLRDHGGALRYPGYVVAIVRAALE